MRRDFTQYLLKVQDQYLEMKNDLLDYEKAFKDGHITEDQLEVVKEDIFTLEQNYQRLVYVDYLLKLPGKEKRKQAYINKEKNKALTKKLAKEKNDENGVIAENKTAIKKVKAKLAKLTKNIKKKEDITDLIAK